MADKILKYTSRDYNSIKNDLVESISALTDDWTSREDSDPGIVLVKLMSAVGDMLSYNFDKQALEYYAPTVTQRKNAAKLFNLVGYPMHWYRTAETTLTLTYEAQMPEYISILKKCVDATTDDDVVEAYYDYRKTYHFDGYFDPSHPESENFISIPPYTTLEQNPTTSNIVPPQKQIEYIYDTGNSRPVIDIRNEPQDISDKQQTMQDAEFRDNALNYFKIGAKQVFTFWQESEPIGIHEYINDINKTLGVYSTSAGSISYSLIPKTVEPRVLQNGEYDATTWIKPYDPLQIKAIQGTLNSIKFTDVQLKDNRFYVPDTAIDETYMYVSYLSVDSNTRQEEVVFLKKTDNLLKTTSIIDEDTGKTIIYFQFGVDDFDYPYIELASYWRNEIPQDSITFTLYYFKTMGKYGNITKNYLDSISTPNSSFINVSNIDTNEAVYDKNGNQLSSPGYNPETAKEAYVNSLNYIMTYDTLVTIYDFERFTKRQEGISNALAVDRQRLEDLNKSIWKVIDSYKTKNQLLNILGKNADENATIDELKQRLYNIQKVVPVYYNSPVTVADSITPPPEEQLPVYTLNMYPICGNFATKNSDNVNIATLKSIVNQKRYPYEFYKIITNDESVDMDECSIQKMLDTQYRTCAIVNVEPGYTAARVFEWRCCGVIHLNKTVTEEDAKLIVSNVINNLADTYSARNVKFGQKIKYMDIIETIMNADPRIQYFDAGLGSKKLIDYRTLVQDGGSASTNYYNTEAYFNPESIMYYNQTVEANSSPTSEIYNYISVDPNYIEETNQQGG